MTLFNREKKKLSLTEAGLVFVREAQSLITHTRDAIDRVQSVQNGNTGFLNIGYLASMIHDEFLLTVHNFHEKNPGVHLKLKRTNAVELYRDFQEGKYDVIFNITAAPFVYEDVVEIPLKKYGFVVCLPPNHRLATRKIIRQKDYLRYIPLDTNGNSITIMLCYRKDHSNPVIDAFIKECIPVEE